MFNVWGQFGNSWLYDVQCNWSEQFENNEDVLNQCVGQLQIEWGFFQFIWFFNLEGMINVLNDF